MWCYNTHHPSSLPFKEGLLTPEQTRSYLPQDGYEQELTSFYRTGQVLKRDFIHR